MMMSLKLGAYLALGAFLFATTIPEQGYSQDQSQNSIQRVADSGDTHAQLKLGEALVYGINGYTQDVEAGVSLLERSALNGNIEAKASLGKILIEDYYLPANWPKGRRLLEDAAAAGNSKAQVTLGVALVWGLYGDPEPAQARNLLQQAVDNNDIDAMTILGELLVGGYGLDQDVEAGQVMLENAVAAGNVKAKVALGSFLLYGPHLDKDLPHARTLFEEAAASGDGEGIKRLGEMMMWDLDDTAMAEEYLRRAGEMGRSKAWTALAEGAMYGYLGFKSRRKFDGFATLASAAGEERVAVLEANRKLWGISMRASGPEAIEGLEQAAEAGNTEAAKFLIGLVRNGNRYNVRREPKRARAYIEQYSDLFTPIEIEQLSMSIDVANARTIPQYKALAADFNSRPELKSSWMGKELFKANPNFAIYLLQGHMKRDAVYSGSLNGFATRRTLRSILHECRTFKDSERCGDAPLNPNVIGALLAR